MNQIQSGRKVIGDSLTTANGMGTGALPPGAELRMDHLLIPLSLGDAAPLSAVSTRARTLSVPRASPERKTQNMCFAEDVCIPRTRSILSMLVILPRAVMATSSVADTCIRGKNFA